MKQKKVKKLIKGVAAIFSACFATILFSSTMALATTFYVDPAGNDNWPGTEAQPWQTLGKVNGWNFNPGDIIKFKKGGVWNGQLIISRAGTAGSVITFTSYGTATNKPRINAQGLVRDAIYIANTGNYVVVDGFAVTNYDGADIFDGSEARRTGIRVGQWADPAVTMTNVKILNNEIFFVEGCSNREPSPTNPNDGGSPRAAPGAPILNAHDNNQFHNAAIFTECGRIDGLTIQGNYIHDCTCTGILTAFHTEIKSTNVVVKSNSVYNVGSDGIQVWHSQSPLIELNSIIKAGNNSGMAPRGAGVLGFHGIAVCGVWTFRSDSPLLQYNYCEGTKVILYDGQAWDFDIETTGAGVYQYNYSRDNEGGFNLAGLSAGDAGLVFRYNVSYNDGSKQGQGEGFFNGACKFYNNVFYRNDGKEFHFDNFIKCTGTFMNNIFYTNSSIANTYVADNRVFSNNNFFGHTANSPGTSPIFSNPSFVDVNGATKVPPGVILNSPADLRSYMTGFKLSSGSSPCANTGTTVPNGGLDFWGNTLYNGAPDIGAHEFTGGSSNSISITNTSAIANDQTFNIAGVSTTDWVMPNVDEKSGGTAISISSASDWQDSTYPNFSYNNGTTFTGSQTRKSYYHYDQPTASVAVPAGSGTLYLWLGSGSTNNATVTVTMGSATTGAVAWGGRQQFTLSYNASTASTVNISTTRGSNVNVGIFAIGLAASTSGGGSISITNTSAIANDQTFNVASVSTTDWVLPNVDEKSGGTAISISAANDWQDSTYPNFTYNNGTTFTGNQTRKSYYHYDQPTASIAVPAGSGTLYLWLGSGSTTNATVTATLGSATTGPVTWGGKQQFTLSYTTSAASTINVSTTRGSNVNVGIFAIGLAASAGGGGGQRVPSEMKEEIVSVFPNPVNDNTLNIRIYSDNECEAKINMFSPTSQKVADLQWSLVKGENNFEMRVDHFKKGLHLLIINKGNERIVKKVIIDE